ncbi:MAG: Smr/MutS family protein [Oscillospiraceae bacterium]
MAEQGIVELDLHGMTQTQARAAVESALRRTPRSVYRLRLIHGYHGGTALRDMLRRDFAQHRRVLRVELGLNQGCTDLVLREWY